MVNEQRVIHTHRSPRGMLYRVFDALAIVLCLFLVSYLTQYPWPDGPWGTLYIVSASLAVVVFLFIAEHFQIYSSWLGLTLRRELPYVALAWAWTILGLLLLAFMTQTSGYFPRSAILLWFVATPMMLGGWRFVFRAFLRTFYKNTKNKEYVAIYGFNELGVRLSDRIQDASWMGVVFSGFYEDRETHRDEAEPLVKNKTSISGNMHELVDAAREGRIDIVFITLSMKGEERMKYLIRELSDTTVSVYLVPDVFAFDLLHARVISVSGIPAISITENPFYGIDGWLKRLEDIVLASIILMLIAIPMLFIAAYSKLTSSGPVLYRQQRYGFSGEKFWVWKFRTMYVNESDEEFVQASRDDERVTKFGEFLRRTSLDELPQFLNVLHGTMSIVGPRPHAVAMNESHRSVVQGYMLRHKVKPGITGWAQINGWRGETDTLEKMEKRIEFDLAYIRNWSLAFDLKIVVLTIARGFRHKNAY